MRKKESSAKPRVSASHRDRSPKRIERSRALRQTATEAENRAWFFLRKLRVEGIKFRRQHPIGKYVVDFCCTERRLVIELDGSIHSQPSHSLKDRTRVQYLKEHGYTIAQFPNGMVLEAPETFVEKILVRVSALTNVFT